MLTDKRIFLGIAIGALVLILVGIYNDANIISNSTAIEKHIELRDTKIVGFKDKRKTWEVKIKYAWAGANRDQYNIENAYDGKVYNDKGWKVLDRVKGDKAVVHSESEDFDANGNINAYIYLYKNKKRTRVVFVRGEEIHYDADSKMTFIDKNISAYEADNMLSAQNARIDHENSTIYLKGKPVFKKRKEIVTIKSEDMIVNWDENRVIASTNVTLIRGRQRRPNPKYDPREIKLRKEVTTMKCDYMDYIDKKNDDQAECQGNIIVYQPGKKIMGDRGSYSEKNDTIFLIGRTQMVTEKLDWMMKSSTKKDITGKEPKKMIKKKTKMWADMMTLFIGKKDVDANQNVRVMQGKREAKADRSVYKDKEEKIYLYDNVRIQDEKKNWIECKRGLADLRAETFDAIDQVKAKFNYERKTKEDYR